MPSWTTWQSVCFCVLQASWLLSRKVQEVRWDKEQHSLCRLEVMLDESNTEHTSRRYCIGSYQCCFLILMWFDFSWLRLICFEFFTFLWLSIGKKSRVEHSIESVSARVSWSQNIPEHVNVTGQLQTCCFSNTDAVAAPSIQNCQDCATVFTQDCFIWRGQDPDSGCRVENN